MKISKYLHSCLVFEQDDYQLLFDPGKFSFAEGRVKPEMFSKVNAIIVTHIHPDHLDVDALKEIVKLSGAPVYTNAQVSESLNKAEVSNTVWSDGEYELGPFRLEAFEVQHEPLLDSPIPQMLGFIINGKVLHPVDSMEESLLQYKGIELLLMVTMAPFTTELKIANFVDRLQPKQVLPVHDGYARDFFVEQRHSVFKKHFEAQQIKFHSIYKVGESIEV